MAGLSIWCNIVYPPPLADELRRGLAGHRLVPARRPIPVNLASGDDDALIDGCDAAFGQPPPQAIVRNARLRWVHLNTAGYERFDTPEVRAALAARGGMLTTSSSVYCEPCAQHVLAMMLTLARRLPEALDNQRNARQWPAAHLRGRSHLLCGQHALLLGFGAIGRRLAELLAPFRMRITAVRRTPAGDERVEVAPVERVDELLPLADHVVNLLPGGSATAGFMSARRIGLMKPTAIFYNIGRGTTVDQDALADALRGGRLAAAYLDVMSPEPLPPEHALWTVPNCHITPHTAGGHADEQHRILRHFLDNLRRFESAGPLLDRVI